MLHKFNTVCSNIPVSCDTSLSTLSTVTAATVISVLLGNSSTVTTESSVLSNFTQPISTTEQFLTTTQSYTTNFNLSNATFRHMDYYEEYNYDEDYDDGNDTLMYNTFKLNYSTHENFTVPDVQFFESTEMNMLSTYSENETVSSLTDNFTTESIVEAAPENLVLSDNNSVTKIYTSLNTEETTCYVTQCSDVPVTTLELFSDKSSYVSENGSYTCLLYTSRCV